MRILKHATLKVPDNKYTLQCAHCSVVVEFGEHEAWNMTPASSPELAGQMILTFECPTQWCPTFLHTMRPQ